MKNLVVLSGAGISAESGLRTFRDSNGLWEQHSIYEVATPEAWARNPELVLRFYNERRRQLQDVMPNDAHLILVELEARYNVFVITQNVDNLHERAGSKNIVHLHGELTKARSSSCEDYVVDVGYREITLGEYCPWGSQLRPHVVWFGEAVPMMDKAYDITQTADIFIVIGTSLNVYPAAGLLDYVPKGVPIYVLDPANVPTRRQVTFIKESAVDGMKTLKEMLLRTFDE